ncbi:CPBP family intramembrane glutamic endopeptidase [Terrisporobacter petrolearius]|uniref:CPBP family intramembrane glutamic endopeptidase n=1 Tax=Terrisporobacter petrolearius TaxID=1460447 RepID=UPI0022E3CD9D|nr:CPBP family intramembrane glutamic endopeptidase [Terrisporobacter petrolearius]
MSTVDKEKTKGVISLLPKYFFNFCGAILIFLVTCISLLLVQIFERTEGLSSSDIINAIIFFTGYFLIILVFCKIYNNGILENAYRKISIKSLLDYNKKDTLLTFSLLIIGLSFLYLFSNVIFQISPGDDPNIEISNIILISAFTFRPFMEELIFRGIYFNVASDYLDMKNNVVKNIVIITNIILFIIIHNKDWNCFTLSAISYALPTLLISISFTYVYVKTKDIKYNIILHMLYNFLCIFTL